MSHLQRYLAQKKETKPGEEMEGGEGGGQKRAGSYTEVVFNKPPPILFVLESGGDPGVLGELVGA